MIDFFLGAHKSNAFDEGLWSTEQPTMPYNRREQNDDVWGTRKALQ